LGSLAVRLKFGGGLANIAGMAVCSSLMNDDRANRQAQSLDVLGGLLPFLALRAGLVDDNKGRWIAGELQEVCKLWQGLKSEKMRLYWNDNNIGQAGGLCRVCAGMWRRIDDKKIDSLGLGLVDGGFEPCRVGGNHPRKFISAAVRPL
jgi:hypothetical protein